MPIFKKIRTYYWLIQSFGKRHYKIILTTSVLALVLALLLSFTVKYLPSPKKTIRIAKIGKFSSGDIPEDIKRHLSQGLISLDGQAHLKPALAQTWQIDPNGKTYLFHLKKLYWQDQTPLKAQDIKLPFKEVKTVYPNDSTVKFELQEPFAPFIYFLSQPILKNQTIGIGPYRLEKLQINKGILQRIVLTSSKEKLIYKFYPTETSALTAFKLGEVDKVPNLSYYPQEFKNQARIKLDSTTDYWRIATLFFNNNDSNLSNKSIRQALAYAIKDKSFGYQRAISPISKKSWAFNPNVKTYRYDFKHAQKLFTENVKHPENFHLEIKASIQYLDIAEKIAADWRQAFKIKTNVSVNPNLGEGYQVALIDFKTSLDPDQYSIWHSTQTTNFTHYQNLKIDKLLENGRKTVSLKLRKQIYQEFQRFLLEDSPAVFLFYPQEYSLTRQRFLPF